MSTNPTDPAVTIAEMDMLAGDYVLGVLSPDEMREVEQKMTKMPALKTAIIAWQERMLPLNDTADPVAPTPLLWSKIQQQIAEPETNIVPFKQPVMQTKPKAGFANSLVNWRSAAIGAIAASLVLIAGTGLFNRQSVPQRSAVAVLLSADAKPGAMVEIYPGNRTVVVPLGAIPVPSDRALQVWTLIDPAKGPLSIGLMTESVKADLRLEGQSEVREGQLYEISLEPRTGSPTGRPTGPVLFKGYASLNKI